MTQTNMLVSFGCVLSVLQLRSTYSNRVNVIDLVKFDRAQTQL